METKETLQIKNEQGNMWRKVRYRRIFCIDPTTCVSVCITGCTSTGVILYIIAAIIMPEEY